MCKGCCHMTLEACHIKYFCHLFDKAGYTLASQHLSVKTLTSCGSTQVSHFQGSSNRSLMGAVPSLIRSLQKGTWEKTMDGFCFSCTRFRCCSAWFCVKLTPDRAIREDGASVEEMPPCDPPGCLLSQLVIVMGGPSPL